MAQGYRLPENRLLATIIVGAALVVATIAALATGSVWALFLALAVHFAVTAVVATRALRLLTQVEKQDPTTVARLQQEGVADPEGDLNAALRAEGASRAAEQAEATTPAGVATERVGRGRDRALGDV